MFTFNTNHGLTTSMSHWNSIGETDKQALRHDFQLDTHVPMGIMS